ncbi:hypothetical protein CRUP_017943 [Coryphaenoides rupestris]|nr:hypothetical protein CRUP_017943 [Coryphaenoides rupestris]
MASGLQASRRAQDSMLSVGRGAGSLSLAGDVSGGLLVDVGSGPTLYQVLSGCEIFERLVLTDFLEVNRQELKRWLQDQGPGSLDWTPYLQHVCKLEGRGLPRAKPHSSPRVTTALPSFTTILLACLSSPRALAWSEKAARLRAVVSDVLPIDVHCPQPLAPGVLPPGADCLVSCFCLESVSPDLDAFTRALGHIGGLLRPGGHLLLIGALGESFYLGGPGLQIPVVPLDEAQVCCSLRQSGYTLVRLEVYNLPQDMRVGVDDEDLGVSYQGTYTTLSHE